MRRREHEPQSMAWEFIAAAVMLAVLFVILVAALVVLAA